MKQLSKDEYIERIIQLDHKTCKRPEDYTPEKVKISNSAHRKMEKIWKRLLLDPEMLSAVLGDLLENEDDHVRGIAATYCLLRYHFHEERAKLILEEMRNSDDITASWGADRTLRIYRGELDPKKPF